MKEKLTIEKFIERAREKHHILYEYDDVVYKGVMIKVKIWCNKCKNHFDQKPHDHIHGNKGKGQGCPVCNNNLKRSSKSDFIKKSINNHGLVYGYEDVIYINNHTKIKIYCKKCEKYFEQTPCAHLYGRKSKKGQGCPICNGGLSNGEIINNLTIEEEPIVVDDIIQCKCTFCREYFTPTRLQLYNRMGSLSGRYNGENRLYCSNECKDLCPIYGQRINYKDNNITKPDTSRPVQPELRQMVLERDNYTCQICGSSEDLHCHHITGVEINPVESTDIDNCITLCYTCHNKVHSGGQCGVRRQPCIGVA